MLNFLTNAIKFSPPDELIKLIVNYNTLDEENVAVMIQVIDSGIGISVSEQASIFDKNFNSNNPKSRTLNPSSHGFGLSTCNLIAGALKCKIEV